MIKEAIEGMVGVGLALVMWALLIGGGVQAAPQAAMPPPANPEQLLRDSGRAFYLDDYDGALELLERYFTALGAQPAKRKRAVFRFYAIAAMGRIYLQYRQDPVGAIRWFEKIEKSESLSAAEHDIVDGWIAGAKDWIKQGQYPHDTRDPDTLFALGKKYYEGGLKLQKFTMDLAGAADFSIASGYLVPFIVHDDKDSRVGEALYMMGDIRRRLWANNEFWSENYYLTETIRRFPGTSLAVKAYEALREDVHFGYSGSGGDHTPASWLSMLSEFKKIAASASAAAGPSSAGFPK